MGTRTMTTTARARWQAAAIAAAIAGLLTACSGGGVAAKTMTQAQATQRAQTILRETAVALDPEPTLEVAPLTTYTDQCLADIPNASQMVTVAYTYYLRDVPASRYGSIGQQIKAYWQKRGYTISTSGGFSGNQPAIYGQTKDAFLISLDSNSQNTLYIGATSPCVYPHGTPPS
jgi:hypothetical protein